MSGKKNIRIKFQSFSAAFVLILLLVPLSLNSVVRAAELGDKSISISTSFASDPVEHFYSFDKIGVSTVSSIMFEYCSNSPLQIDACTPPSSFDVSTFNLTGQTGMTGFVKSVASTAHQAIITRGAAAEPSVLSTYTIDNFNNPGLPNDIVYVRISVFDGPDATGTRVDEGSVVFVVEERYDISAYVPPYLTFCSGVTVALDCSSTAGFLADFGEFSSGSTNAVTSQFSVATNDPTGYNTYISGQTLTSGNNIIPAMPTQTGSIISVSQFGLNLRANSNPSVGANPDIGAVASGSPDPNYNVVNLFRYNNNDRVAFSSISTGFNRYTASYIVNVSDSQSPGVYAATLAYTAIASF